jgi:hypothetical protein
MGGQKRNSIERYKKYIEWVGDDAKKKKLREWLEKAGVPLELRTVKILGEQGYRCSTYHCQDPETGKYREVDIYATKVSAQSFNIGECEIVFNILILAECKYSYNFDFLAFESKDRYFPAFPVIFTGERMLGASYQDFTFPMIIRKIAETDALNLELSENFQDKKTHEACEKLTSSFSHVYKRRMMRIGIDRSKYRLYFEPILSNFLRNHSGEKKIDLLGEIGEFLRKNFEPQKLLSQIPYFPIEIGFPLMVIHENRGLIRIKYDMITGQVVDFEDVGYGIYPYVSENADKYNNILHEYFAFPIIICNLTYLNDCLKTLNKGIEKMMTYAKGLLQNDPYAIPEEILEDMYIERILSSAQYPQK